MSTLPDAASAQQQLLKSAWCASILIVHPFARKSIAFSDNLITEFTAPDTKIAEGGKAPTTRR